MGDPTVIGSGAGAASSNSEPAANSLTQQKAALEIRKLETEIEEIQTRLKGQRGCLARLREWSGVLVTVVALITGGWGLFSGFSAFLEQQKNAYEFELKKDMITLASQLATGQPTERASAALLLSAFEEHAISVLLANLAVEGQPEVRDRIVRSLVLIADKPRVRDDKSKFLHPLVEVVSDGFAKQVKADRPRIEVLNNYLVAMEALGPRLKDPKVLATLADLRRMVSAGDTQLEENQRQNVLQRIARIEAELSR